ncbi:MAG: ABA4-like family protein [Pseudomonadota bacterium]
MSYEIDPRLNTIFDLKGKLTMVGWLALATAPLWSWATMVASLVIALLCLIYVYLLAFGRKYDGGAPEPGPRDFFSLKGVLRVFQNPRTTLAGWTHFLAFDLFVGLFIVMDSQQIGLSHWLVLPLLFATLMFGPAGLLLYIILRVIMSGDLAELDLAVF